MGKAGLQRVVCGDGTSSPRDYFGAFDVTDDLTGDTDAHVADPHARRDGVAGLARHIGGAGSVRELLYAANALFMSSVTGDRHGEVGDDEISAALGRSVAELDGVSELPGALLIGEI